MEPSVTPSADNGHPHECCEHATFWHEAAKIAWRRALKMQEQACRIGQQLIQLDGAEADD